MIRKIEYNDFNKSFMDLINTFTRTPNTTSYDEFCNYINKIRQQNSEIYVIEEDNKIISTIKIFIEQKIHNNFKTVGHIEDLVTHLEYRKRGLARSLLNHAINECKLYNVYKIILSTNIENINFYLNNGFKNKGVECCLYV